MESTQPVQPAHDFEETVESILDRRLTSLHTAVPVRVVKDSDGHTVSLQPLLKRMFQTPDGKQTLVDFPILTDIPINFASGGGTTFTHPIKEKDEGMALIASGSIDAWFQNGGEQPEMDARRHSLSDAIYLPGVRNTPRKLKDVSTTAAQIRSDDGKHYSELDPKKGITHSVDGGKHVVSMSPEDGIRLLADAGKHIMTLHPKNGVGIETGLALAMKAAQGMALKGALKVDGKLTSTQPIGGSVLAGLLGGVIGAIVSALVIVGALMATSAPPEGVQQASYRIAAIWGR